MYDDNYYVARAAMNSAGTLGGDDFLFVPPLVSLLRNRRLKAPARKVLVGYGEAVVPTARLLPAATRKRTSGSAATCRRRSR